MTTASFVGWSLAAPWEELDSFLISALGTSPASGADAILPHPDVETVSLFRDTGKDTPILGWYVEHEDSSAWKDPATVIRDTSPLFEQGLEGLLSDSPPRVIADGSEGIQELVHATLPQRPRTYPDQRSRLPILCGDPDGNDARSTDSNDTPDVVLIRLKIRPGVGSALARLFGWLFDRTPEWLESRFETWTEPILEAEGMYTETLLLEHAAERYVLWWYMETGDMGQVYEAYEESDSRIARLSERVLGLALENPARIIQSPMITSDFELLAHAVSKDRV